MREPTMAYFADGDGAARKRRPIEEAASPARRQHRANNRETLSAIRRPRFKTYAAACARHRRIAASLPFLGSCGA